MATGNGGKRSGERFRSSFVLALLLGLVGGCDSILGIHDIEPCWDAAGNQGRGCYRSDGGCKLTKEQIPNACTAAICVPFDNAARLGLDAADGLPVLEMQPDGGGGIGGAGGSGGSGGVGGAGGSGGAAPPPCNGLPEPRVLVVGSNAVEPALEYLGAELSGAALPITVLYQRKSSCAGAADLFEDLVVSGIAKHYRREAGEIIGEECTLGASEKADIATCDVFASTCGLIGDFAKIKDSQGPIQAMIFIAPKGSSERAISAEGARLIYGYGGKYQSFEAKPWIDPAHILRRDAPSGTQNMIGAFIGVPSSRFSGKELTSTTAMTDEIAATGAAEASSTIGLLDVVNGDGVGSLRALAFQAKGQTCAFLPDSAEGTSDKRNVRDGHYMMWGPIHVFSSREPPLKTAVEELVDYLILERAPGDVAEQDGTMSVLIQKIAERSLVPQCAMRVQRLSEGGGLLPYVPTRSCACYFDKVRTGETSCQACTTSEQCASSDAPRCNFGFCEPQ